MINNIINCGVDLDGVCANFSKKFSELCNESFGNRCYIIEDPSTIKFWDWHVWYPIKKSEVDLIWNKIIKMTGFWVSLELLNKGQWQYFIDKIGKNNRINVYFITTRQETTGMTATRQSAIWLETNSWKYPFVIKTHQKEKFIKDLNIEFFIDDNAKNLINIKNDNPNCKIYAQDAEYNKEDLTISGIEYKRVSGLRQFADDILQELYNRDYNSTWKKNSA